MEWLNIHTSTLDSETFLDATPDQHSVWLRLLRFCAGQENGGKIKGCRAWSEEKVLVTMRCRKADLIAPCDLWTWSDDDLCVEYYPKRAEKELQSQRRSGKAGAMARWRKTADQTPPKSPPDSAPPDGGSNPPPTGHHDGDPIEDPNAKGKGREGKEREIEGARDPDSVRAEWVHRIVAAYPKRTDQLESEKAVLAALVDGDDPQQILAGTEAIARVLHASPAGPAGSFVPSRLRFFKEKKWKDDPEAWRQQYAGKKPEPEGLSASFGSERVKVASPRINGLPGAKS